MFSRISFSFPRAFRFRSRRVGKPTGTSPPAASSPARASPKRRAQTLVLQPPLPSPALQTIISPVVQSPLPSATSPSQTGPASPNGPVILIGHEQGELEKYFIAEKERQKESAAPLQHEEARGIIFNMIDPHPVNVNANTKHVSFDQSASVSHTRSAGTSRSVSPASELEPHKNGDFPFLKEPPPTYHEARGWGHREDGEWVDELDIHTDLQHSKRRSLKRSLSLFNPRLARSNTQRNSVPPKPQRFSVPVLPGYSVDDKLARRTSKRKSTASTMSTNGQGQGKAKRQSRWSREWHSEETQEVLRALRDMA
ncbi:hypothetical protein BJ138DRAFT_1112147 [Hygrophoropsis aurantiaca]|uniref:Uncharacterized protein n=1 Tax=Hygrophoropsis aurantiaca TaxID=72124 RepID=A0ACB8AH49_9AGAM|nr:hypothetical protein BJ138DRAFT_1112147 [Hygrophoropsis aurantiaca]